jgi:hypothetical protein
MKKRCKILIETFFVIVGVLILVNGCKKDEGSSKKDPVITWANPTDISVGTSLSATQLNATADAAGTFVYTPAIGTILNAGTNQDLKVDFTPTDGETYNTASKTVKINVTLAVGDNYQGGKVAYILVSGDPGYVAGQMHGLIAAPTDQSTGIPWCSVNPTVTGATATALGTGNDNTSTIVASQGAGNYAAKMCSDLVLGGYNDWFLPSQDELNKLFLNKLAIGGFASDTYWSSTETNNDYAWVQFIGDGNQYNISKLNTNYVRAVRAF